MLALPLARSLGKICNNYRKEHNNRSAYAGGAKEKRDSDARAEGAAFAAAFTGDPRLADALAAGGFMGERARGEAAAAAGASEDAGLGRTAAGAERFAN